ncbi:DUF262 domain-containing protein [Pseudomonas sp. URMO17WK12:I4]|uniref:DUF262 domain-containing protein n=1 Tax=Pseudomonas sp. URMO17WK12:I4 TaxID=1283292 RepID=UPI0005688855|nr:DUF262 domain-containing protein [Pseudomonas sp. URMO17WK12:I4]
MSQVKVLEKEIDEARRTISTDGYPMSIGELTNLYKDGELIIRPEFQRFFRWTNKQKSTLIESILLGIPIPSIFVAQTETGQWELVDGLQRVSTLLQVQGELYENGVKVPALELQGTKYLTGLEGVTWDNADLAFRLSDVQKLDIKRAKLDLKIIKRESSTSTKFDLFQRLNSYGSTLNAQEMRSALLVAASPECFSWMESLSSDPDFRTCTQLSERLIEERYDLELVVRFLVLHNRPEQKIKLSLLRDLPQILDAEAIEIAESFPNGVDELERVFKETFRIIAESGGDKIFKKWDVNKQEFKGSFLNSSFEVFALGLGYLVRNNIKHRDDLLSVVKDFWSRPGMSSGFATGRSTEARLSEFMPLGRELLKG